jgi:transcriptional regulator with XRE-family HTH domain
VAHLFDVSNIPDEDSKDRRFGARLKALRQSVKMGIRHVVAETNIPESRLLSLESGHAEPSIKTKECQKLADCYGIKFSDLIDLMDL